MGEFRMPSLGADMTEGRVLEWLVAPGDRVARGDIVAVVQTDKADLDVEVFEDGVVDQLVVPVGEKVPVGTVLAVLRPVGSTVAATPSRAAPQPAGAPEPVLVGAGREPIPSATGPVDTEPAVTSPVLRHLVEELHVDLHEVHPSGPGRRVHRDDLVEAARASHAASPATPAARRARRVSPRARRLAAEQGVALDDLAGSGPGGAVIGADVERSGPVVREAPRPDAPAPAPAVAEPETRSRPARRGASPERLAARRKAIGDLMARSWREIPHYHLRRRIDLARALAWLDERNAERPVHERILPAALLLRAVALAASEGEAVNGFFVDGAFQPSEHVHLGVAVALRDGGLVTPAIHDAETKPLPVLMDELRDLVTRARTGRLRARETTGATITVTNLGDLGVDEVSGVIFPPQVALVGFGAIRDEPWAESGMLGVRPVVHATLAADHRVSDGRAGAQLLTLLERHLREPEGL